MYTALLNRKRSTAAILCSYS